MQVWEDISESTDSNTVEMPRLLDLVTILRQVQARVSQYPGYSNFSAIVPLKKVGVSLHLHPRCVHQNMRMFQREKMNVSS
jgi:hypothetical protein